MNTKPLIKLKLASRRVIIDTYTEPSERLIIEALAAPTLRHSPLEVGVALITAQPFARPAKPKLQRSRVLARRALPKKAAR